MGADVGDDRLHAAGDPLVVGGADQRRVEALILQHDEIVTAPFDQIAAVGLFEVALHRAAADGEHLDAQVAPFEGGQFADDSRHEVVIRVAVADEEDAPRA